MAFAITTILCLALTIFAFQTKWDFTGMGAYLLAGLLILLVASIVAFFVGRDRITQIVLCSIGVFLFSLYLIYNTQLMIGGKHKFAISSEEYIFAVLCLYLDIVNIFIRILMLLSYARQ